jgi:uncharacterized repeat protein (TIGR01451 family)
MHITVDKCAQKPGRKLSQASRWIVFISTPLLLLSFLYLNMQNATPVKAATTRTAGSCLDPGPLVYSTIQEAVNAAAPGDTIDICPGTYPESVDLSGMVLDGDITLRKAPGTTGQVLINPPGGAGILISGIVAFPGSVTLQELDITAQAGNGIQFFPQAITGTLTLDHIKANNNSVFGAWVIAHSNILVTDSEFNNNVAEGLSIQSRQNTDVINTIANNNGFRGIGIYQVPDFCEVGPTHVNIINVTANENLGWGIYSDSVSDVTIDGTTVISNGIDGAFVLAFSDIECSRVSDIVVTDSLAELNGWGGILATGDEVTTAAIYEPGGFRLYADYGTITVGENTRANQNTGFGFCIDTYAETHVSNSSAQGNLGEGFLLTYGCADAFGRSAVEGEQTEESEVRTSDLSVLNGFLPSLVISNSSAIANGTVGFSIQEPDKVVTITEVSATGNITGIAFSEPDCGCPGSEGTEDVETEDVGALLSLSGATTSIDNSLIQSNASHGVYYEQHLPTMVEPTAVDATGASDVGVNGLIEPYTSTNTIASSIICQNGIGLEAAQSYDPFFPVQFAFPYTLLVNAQGNWWGDATGPMPSGGGNSIVIRAQGSPTNTVQVPFAPWINGAYGTAAPNPTLAGIPVNLSYQFHDGTATYFLENGVGDPNGGPLFTLSTSNGVITPPVDKFITNRLITGVATPASAGPMSIQLSGPCGLSLDQPVVVAQPSISVAKTPDDQTILSGSSAVFNVSVMNTGNISLTNVVVEDAEVGTCASSALPVLAPGQSADVTCQRDNVTSNFVNTAIARGTALVGGVATGSPVSASDTANVSVVVPAIAISKSPDAQGVAPGESATFTITVSNTGNVALTNIQVDDPIATLCARTANALGPLAPGASESYVCDLPNVTNNLVNQATASGTALIGGVATGSPVSASDTANVFVASISLVKTAYVAGYKEVIAPNTFNPSQCALNSAVTVPVNTTVKYCYTVTNTGDYTLTVHSLVDDHLGSVFSNFVRELAPGQSFSTVDAGFTITKTLTVSTTNVATWTALIAPPIVSLGTDATDASVSVAINAQATVTISSANLDQDSDGIPDNIEGSGDTNVNGIPDFLDAAGPTNEEPVDQPSQLRELFIPSLGNNR